MAGYEDDAASNRILCYWKNGVKTALTAGKPDSTWDMATAITLGGR